MGRHPGGVAAALLCAMLVAATGCGQGTANDTSPAAPLVEGWNELPPAPYPAAMEDFLTFWTGTELIVAGGTEFPAPYDNVTHRTETYAYAPETGQWRTLSPIVVPGYDGVQALTGAWTGTAWVGVAFPCTDGDVIDEVQSVACDQVPIGLRWTPDGGWTVSPQPIAAESVGGRVLDFNVAGMTAASVILANENGFLTYELPDTAESGWTFRPWPDGAAAVTAGAACIVDDQLVTVSTVLRDFPSGSVSAEGQEPSYPQTLSANLLAADGAVLRSWPLVDLPMGLRFEPYCQPGVGIYVDAGLDQPILRVDTAQVTPLQAPTSGPQGGVYAFVSYDWADVGTGVVSLSPTGTYFLDSAAGALTVLQPVPSMDTTVWSGSVLFVTPVISQRWFAFLPRGGSWPESADLPFPFTIEGN